MPTNEGNKRPHVLVISISAPLLLAVALALLWFTNNLDGLIARAGAPGLTHACVNADGSFENAARCLVYRSEQSQSSSTPDNTGSAVATTTPAPSASAPATATSSAAEPPPGAPGFCTGILWRTMRDARQICPVDHSLLSDTRLVQLKWTSWGARGASASGTLLTGCSGHNCQITEPAEVRLDSPQSCPDGATIYSRETIAANHIGNPNSTAIGCDGTAGGGGG